MKAWHGCSKIQQEKIVGDCFASWIIGRWIHLQLSLHSQANGRHKGFKGRTHECVFDRIDRYEWATGRKLVDCPNHQVALKVVVYISLFPDTTSMGLPCRTAEKWPGVVDWGSMGWQSYGSPMEWIFLHPHL